MEDEMDNSSTSTVTYNAHFFLVKGVYGLDESESDLLR